MALVSFGPPPRRGHPAPGPYAAARPRAVRAVAVRSAALLLALAAVVTAAAGCGDGGPPERHAARVAGRAAEDAAGGAAALPAEFTRQRLDWRECTAAAGTAAPAALPDGTRWECATLRAPLDYADPSHGGTLGLAMIRARADGSGKDPGARLGSLLFNFGGPGGSGVTALPAFADGYRALRARYDLVSFDPRGVGRSSGVRCLGQARLDAYFAADWTPDTAAEERALLRRQERFAQGCQRHSGRVLAHIGTEDAARDLDLMRAVLGDDKLHYLGFSYGTELGAVYAHLFPRRVGRAVLDAVVDPDRSPRQGALAQTHGFQRALEDFLADCARKGPDCPLGTDPEAAGRGVASLLKRLDGKPLPTGTGRELTESLATAAIAQSLYSPALWDYLAEALEEAAEDGTGQRLLRAADAMNGRSPDGRYDTLQTSLVAIGCADARQRYAPADIRRALPRFTDASAVFGPYSAWSLASCRGWPVEGRRDAAPVSATGAAPILLVGTTGDPATPYQGTRRMKRRLGAGVAVELTYRGAGHGAYGSGNRCVRDAVDGYLLRGDIPADGTVCG